MRFYVYYCFRAAFIFSSRLYNIIMYIEYVYDNVCTYKITYLSFSVNALQHLIYTSQYIYFCDTLIDN